MSFWGNCEKLPIKNHFLSFTVCDCVTRKEKSNTYVRSFPLNWPRKRIRSQQEVIQRTKLWRVSTVKLVLCVFVQCWLSSLESWPSPLKSFYYLVPQEVVCLFRHTVAIIIIRSLYGTDKIKFYFDPKGQSLLQELFSYSRPPFVSFYPRTQQKRKKRKGFARKFFLHVHQVFAWLGRKHHPCHVHFIIYVTGVLAPSSMWMDGIGSSFCSSAAASHDQPTDATTGTLFLRYEGRSFITL